MKKIWIGIVIVLFLALAAVFFIIQSKKPAEEIKIGAILPLTGDAAIYGQEIKNGIELAVEEINIKRRSNEKPIKVIYEDEQGQARIGVTAMEKLIKIDSIPVIIGGAMSSVAVPLASIAKNNNVVLLSPTATTPVLSGISKYFFRIWPSDNYDGSFMATFAYDNLSLRSVGILYVNTDYGKGIEEVFKKEFEKIGGKILISESYDLGATDFRAQLAKIKNLNPEAIYLPGYYKELAGILRQIKELGYRGKILSVNSFYDPKLLEISGASAEGSIFTYPLYDPKSDSPIIQSFVHSFKEKYDKEPDAFAVQGYDALKIVVLAIEKGGYTSDGIQLEMSKIIDFPGVGGKMSFDINGDVVKSLRILIVKDGKFVSFVEK